MAEIIELSDPDDPVNTAGIPAKVKGRNIVPCYWVEGTQAMHRSLGDAIRHAEALPAAHDKQYSTEAG